MALKNGVPRSFLQAALGDRDTLRKLVLLAGAMERQGASVTEQQIAVWETLVKIWERAPISVKATVLGDNDPREDTAVRTPNQPAQSTKAKNNLGAASQRLLKVAGWAWRIMAVSAVITCMISAALLFVVAEPAEGVGVFVVAVVMAFALTGAIWLAIYVTNGLKCNFDALFVRIVLGDLPAYFWFVVCVLYVGGAGTAIWFGGSNEEAFRTNFSAGVGGAFAILALGSPGWFLFPVRYKYIGHVVGTMFVAVAILVFSLSGPSVT